MVRGGLRLERRRLVQATLSSQTADGMSIYSIFYREISLQRDLYDF